MVLPITGELKFRLWFAILKSDRIPVGKHFSEQLVATRKLREEVVEADDEFIVSALYLQWHIDIDAIGGQVISHALRVAMIPCVEIAFYEF